MKVRYLPTILILLCFVPASARAKLHVVATTTDVAALARVVGGDDIRLETIARGSQDPHYIEAKPSYMTKLARADLLIANGLGLETGWLPTLIRGARNPKLNPGQSGHLDLSAGVIPLETPTGKISRAMGDVHPEGNPHFLLDPERAATQAKVIAERLGELDPSLKTKAIERAVAFEAATAERMKTWRARIAKLPSRKLVTHHGSLLYFIKRFELELVSILEAKPGIPPSAAHLMNVIDVMKRENARVILVDNYFDPKVAHRVAKDIPGSSVEVVGIAAESAPGLTTLADVTDGLISALERATKPVSASGSAGAGQ